MRSFHGFLLFATVCICLTGIFSGCAKAPDLEFAAAKSAIKAAEAAEADKYTPNNFSNVQKAFKAAEDEIMVQNGAFVFSRNYKRAKQLLVNTTKLATELKNDAPEKKKEIIAQVEEGLILSEKKIKETRSEIKKAPRGAFSKDARKQMNADLDKAESVIGEGSTAFKAGNIIEARNKIGDAQGYLKKIFDKLSTGDGMSLM